MPDKDNNFGGSLVLDFTKWWRHMQPNLHLNDTIGTDFKNLLYICF